MDTKKLWPTLVALLPLVLSMVTPAITDWVSAHPEIAMTAYTALNAIANVINPNRQA